LEMTAKPEPRPVKGDVSELILTRVNAPDPDWYRDIFGLIGRDLLWFSRLRMTDAELRIIIQHPEVEVFVLRKNGRDVGLLELDFREPGQCELAFFGLTEELVGSAAGRLLMNAAIERAFAKPIKRFWVHTCTLDHPRALPFYIRSGFAAYERMIEIADDPRLAGELPREAAPLLPII
jgi:GNAT superfamily N-acetyltransferase